MKKRDTEDTF